MLSPARHPLYLAAVRTSAPTSANDLHLKASDLAVVATLSPTLDLHIDLATFNTRMAFFLRLSNELIILIASNIRKPSHLLQLALVNKRLHDIAIQHLYENVTFHQDDYPPPSSSSQDNEGVEERNPWSNPPISRTPRDPYSNILRLSDMIGSNTLPACHSVTRLTIVIDMDDVCSALLFELLPKLSSLTHLTLAYVSEAQLPGVHTHFPLTPYAAALSHTSQTLQSLSFHIAPDRADFGAGPIGSLRPFTMLRSLSVQADVLIGSFRYPLQAFSEPDLTSVLPQGLKRLWLSECNNHHIRRLSTLFDGFVVHDWTLRKVTEKVVVFIQTHRANGLVGQEIVPGFTTLNPGSGPRGLDLEMVLEGRDDFHGQENSMKEETLSSLLRECTKKLDEVDR